MNTTDSVLVLGASGLVGKNLSLLLKEKGFQNVWTPRHKELDLLKQHEVEKFFSENDFDYVFMCAGRVGGILANKSYPYEFLYENMLMAAHVMEAAKGLRGLKKLVYLGSSCIYPKKAPVPIKESSLLSGPLEQTNEGYAIAKIAGLKLCEYLNSQKGLPFVSAMPTNLYGPFDNFDPQSSHVLPALLRRFHEAKLSQAAEVKVWGSGRPLREFLYAPDLGEMLIDLATRYSAHETVNLGSGEECSIAELAALVAKTVGYEGQIVFDSQLPDGTFRKGLDCSKLKTIGIEAKTPLRDGLKQTYQWCVQNNIFQITGEKAA